MSQEEGHIVTPREYDYWKLLYREMVLLPEWSHLTDVERAQRLLERINQKLIEPDASPQRKALFSCPDEERVKRVLDMIEYFKSQDHS